MQRWWQEFPELLDPARFEAGADGYAAEVAVQLNLEPKLRCLKGLGVLVGTRVAVLVSLNEDHFP